MVEVATTAVFCGCARRPNALDACASSHMVAFASSRNVVLCKLGHQESRIVGTYPHFTDVTCVRWIKPTESQSTVEHTYLLCSGSDGSSVVWQVQDDQLRQCLTFKTHEGSVVVNCGLMHSDHSATLVTSGSDSVLCASVLDFGSQESEPTTQRISLSGGFVFAVDLIQLDKNAVLMATGHDDNKIRLYARSLYNHVPVSDFIKMTTLVGHTDWIRGVSFRLLGDQETVALASCSQDGYIRLWRLSAGAESAPKSVADLSPDQEIQLRPQTFALPTEPAQCYGVHLEAVLSGHEDWVYSVRWNGDDQLLSASADKCLILWAPDPSTGLWLDKVRLGQVGGQAAGFYGAVYVSDVGSILAHGYHGGLHFWHKTQSQSAETIWQAGVAPSGHFAPVEDLCWEPSGKYLLSCSADQTTRLYAPWVSPSQHVSYHELARPQVHGHDLQCLAVVNSTCFVSGAEEKILRAFEAPTIFVENLTSLSGVSLDYKSDRPAGASVPSLGLSNKALYNQDLTDDKLLDEEIATHSFIPTALTAPPTENSLKQDTLWPEVCKLYGHGYELFCVTTNHGGTIVASACKANKKEQAAVHLWDAVEWQFRSGLESHSLTVTDLAFSPSDKFLLSVSRDRSWSLFAQPTDADSIFEWQCVCVSEKKPAAHSRIIWCCAWSHDSRFFATVSRDKKTIIWLVDQGDDTVAAKVVPVGNPLVSAHPVTAVDFAPVLLASENYLVAVGLESGDISLYSWSPQQSFSCLHNMDFKSAHCLAVKRLRFKPTPGPWGLVKSQNNDEKTVLELASCGSDFAVKVYRLNCT